MKSVTAVTPMSSTFRALVLLWLTFAAATWAHGEAAQTQNQIFLKCAVVNDPEGLNDVHIDFSKKQFTDAFGTVRVFREDGPFLISDTFVEIGGVRQVATTMRINRFTLAYQYLWPAQRILKNGECSIVEKRV